MKIITFDTMFKLYFGFLHFILGRKDYSLYNKHKIHWCLEIPHLFLVLNMIFQNKYGSYFRQPRYYSPCNYSIYSIYAAVCRTRDKTANEYKP